MVIDLFLTGYCNQTVVCIQVITGHKLIRGRLFIYLPAGTSMDSQVICGRREKAQGTGHITGFAADNMIRCDHLIFSRSKSLRLFL